MKNYLAFILVLVCMNAFAQQDTTTVYANPGYNKDPMRSKWIPKVEKQDGLWVLNLYNKKQVLQEKISYADEKLQVRKGPYAFYGNGILKEEGFYDSGHKHGEWKNYSDEGKLVATKNYIWGVLKEN
jgi:antitoxin component YwqK of YwqJK toxin-antitoxin module